ncbi:hypothetical protein KUV51_12715 [Tateyamaria omphalii]|uniref:hypothetical protein n=1 Tax=Tateyamaria omphalii TaxID=299262 RepID=UPI001C99EF87|nr:hypothetical protein [Tateyamaria omphalii]MBY5933865.1 hypothetical protein [Tateyamaria omphalii]
MKNLLSLIIFALTFLSANGAAANENAGPTQTCIAQTGAPGTYLLAADARGLPRVTPGQGATAAGARNVNDCLADVFQIQYGARQRAVATTSGQSGFASNRGDRCARILNRSAATAGTYAFGAALAAGAVGAAAQASVYQRNLNRCLSR